MFKKSLAIIFIVIALCFSFAACGSDTKLLEARIAELEQQLEAAQGIQGPKGDTGEQGPKGDTGDGITVLTEPLALGTTVNVLDCTGLVLFTVKAEETETHWIVTVTNVNMYGQFKVNEYVGPKFYYSGLHAYSLSDFPDVSTSPNSYASSSTSKTYTGSVNYIIVTNIITEIPYAVFKV